MGKFVCLVSVLLSMCSVQSVPNASAGLEGNSQGAKAFIKNLGDKAIRIINYPKITDKKVISEFESIIMNDFAFNAMAKFSLGGYNKIASSSQKEIFLRCFINMLVKLYASNFKEYKTAQFSVVDVREKSKSQFLVESKVIVPGKKNATIVWSVFFADGAFKIYDAIFEDVSVSQIQRAEINGAISQKGFEKFMSEFQTKYSNNI